MTQAFLKIQLNIVLKEAKIEPNEILNVVFYEKPFLKFERLLETYLAFAPKRVLKLFKFNATLVKR